MRSFTRMNHALHITLVVNMRASVVVSQIITRLGVVSVRVRFAANEEHTVGVGVTYYLPIP
jgi:hypothetical protein